MNTAAKCARFDIITLAAYKKTYFFMLFYPIFMVLMTQEPISGITFGMAMSVVILATPFSIEERYHLERLTLPTDRVSQVRGRYLLILSTVAFLAVVYTVESVVVGLLLGTESQWQDVALALVSSVAVVLLMMAIQLPFLYKLGYTKARMIMLAPFVLMGVGIPLLARLGRDFRPSPQLLRFLDVLANNALLVMLLVAALVLVALVVSYSFSLGIYLRKEL